MREFFCGLHALLDVDERVVHSTSGALHNLFDLFVALDDGGPELPVVQHDVEDVDMLQWQLKVVDALLDVGEGQVEILGRLLEELVDLLHMGLEDARHLLVALGQLLVEQVHAEGYLGDQLP